MSYTLELATHAYVDKLEAADIKVNARQNLVITERQVIRLEPDASRTYIERLFKNLIADAKAQEEAKVKERQTELF